MKRVAKNKKSAFLQIGGDTTKKPRTITNQEAEKIRRCLGTVDQLIFDIGCETGLRITDILELENEYLNKIMYIYERKTKKHKIVELSNELWERVAMWKKRNTSNYAFYSPKDESKHLNRSTYHRHIKLATEGLNFDCSAHSTRKLYAHNVFDKTGDILEVQKALNHRYISTTLTYLDIDLQKLIKKPESQD